MAAVPGAPVTSATSNTTTNTSLSVALASTTVGDLNVITISGLATGTGINPTMATPAGWTKVREQMSNSGAPSTFVGIYWKFYQSGDGSAVTFTWANQGQMVASCEPFSNADTTTPVPYSNSIPHSSGAGTTYAITGTTGTDPGLLVYGGANKTGTAWSNLTDNDAGQRGLTSSATMCQRITAAEVAGGTAYSKTMTGSASTIGVQWAFVVKGAAGGAFTGSAAYSAGSALTAAGTFTEADAASYPAGAVLSASGTVTAGGAAAYTAGATLTALAQTPIIHQLLTGGTQYAAHRNGTYATYGEETLEGYLAAYAQYPLALLEVSVWDTSDSTPVYIGSHDNALSRVYGDGRSITTSTWAGLSPNGASTVGRPVTTVGGNPLRRLEEILDAFPSGFFVVENKHGTNQAALCTLLDSHVPGRWMFKGPYNDTANAVIAAGHGAPMWLYFYPSQLGSLGTTYSAVSSSGVPIVFGLGDFSAAPVPVQSDSDTFWSFVTSHGLMAWAHILGTGTQKSNADSQATVDGAAFNGYMVSSFPTLAPTGAVVGSVSLAAGVGLSAGGVPASSAGVAVSVGVALAAGGAPAEVVAVGVLAGVVLSAAAGVAVAVPVALNVGVGFAAVGGPVVTVGVSLPAGAILGAVGTLASAGPAALSVGAVLVAAGAPGSAGPVVCVAGVQLAAAGPPAVTADSLGLSAGVLLSAQGSIAAGVPAAWLVGAVLEASGAGGQGEAAALPAGVVLAVSGGARVAGSAALAVGVAIAAGGTGGVSVSVGLLVGAALAAAGGPSAGGPVVLLAGVTLDASGVASGVLVLFDGSLLQWQPGSHRWAVRAGVLAWQVAAGMARWRVRSWGDDVKSGDRRLVNLQVQSPRPLTDPDVAVASLVSQTRAVPDSPSEEAIVIPADYSWPGPTGWATVAAWVGPGLPVGTNYVITHVTAGGEDFYDVAATVQVEE